MTTSSEGQERHIDCLLDGPSQVHEALSHALGTIHDRHDLARKHRQATGARLDFPRYTLVLDNFEQAWTYNNGNLRSAERIARLGRVANVRLVLRTDMPLYTNPPRIVGDIKVPSAATIGSVMLQDLICIGLEDDNYATVQFEEIGR